MFLNKFKLLDEDKDYEVKNYGDTRRIYNNIYPFTIFTEKQLVDIEFKDITIFYGNNGSGKSTCLI